MKSTILIIILFVTGFSKANGQSHSFQTLKNKFSKTDDVHSFSTSGFLARTILWFAGEHEFTNAINEIKNIHLMVIPHDAFQSMGLSVQGFKKVIRADAFEELIDIREQDDKVSGYLQLNKKAATNRYLILIDNPQELVAIEILGNIDLNKLGRKDIKISTAD